MNMRAMLLVAVVGSFAASTACSLEPPRHEKTAGSTSAASHPHKAVAFAKEMVGAPYRYGGNTPKGFDCSGLVYYSYSKAGYSIGRDSKSQIAQAIHIDPRDLRPGDLVFFDIGSGTTHIGIYTGNGQFIHAPSSGKRVSYASMNDKYWRDHFVRAGRLQ